MDETCSIKWKIETLLPDNDGDYFTPIEGTICSGDEASADCEIGKVTAYIFRVEDAVDDGVPLGEIFDSVSAQTYECLRTAFRNGEDLEQDIFYISHVEVAKEHRGKKVGQMAVVEAQRLFGTGRATVLCPNPTENAPNLSPAQLRIAIGKLQKYWIEIGFRRIKRTAFYAISYVRGEWH